MGKKVQGMIKLQVPAGKAAPSPPVGPILGQRKLNIMEFCKRFNAETQSLEVGVPVPVVITYFSDLSFIFTIKQPPVSYLLKKAARLTKGSSATGKQSAGKIPLAEVTKIAQQKMQDMNAFTLESAVAMVKGTAFSMGLEVVE